ncbi:MAG: hypothetical protein RSE36_04285 [Oscillospiraceae bacterium]
MASSIEAINALQAGREAAYMAQLEQAKAARDAQAKQLEAQYRTARQENYVSNRMAQKNIPQALAAQGIQGGLAETSIVDLNNRYQNANNASQQGYNQQVSDLDLGFFNKQSDISAKLAEIRAESEANRINAAASAASGKQRAYGGYASDVDEVTQNGAMTPEQRRIAIYMAHKDYSPGAINHYLNYGRDQKDVFNPLRR